MIAKYLFSIRWFVRVFICPVVAIIIARSVVAEMPETEPLAFDKSHDSKQRSKNNTLESLELKKNRKKILFLGDSLTAGYGLDISESYPSRIQEFIDENKLAYEVLNAGVSGDTTAGGLSRIAWLLKQDVSVLVIALGANDGLRGFDPDITKANLEKIIEIAQQSHTAIKIVLAGMYAPPNMGDGYGAAYEKMFHEVAKSKDVAFLPFLLEGVAGEADLNLSDGIHPNQEGYRKIAKHVWTYLEPVLGE